MRNTARVAPGSGEPAAEVPDHGPVRYGPSAPELGLPVLPELAAVVAAAAGGAGEEPVGGGDGLLAAAAGHWARRGLPTDPGHVAAAPGASALLHAVTAAVGGDVLLPRPCPAWWAPQLRLQGRRAWTVPTPAECGGIPDPYALLETVRRVRAEGGDPRLLLLSVADDPTATVPPPEALYETVRVAAGEGLHLVSDETWRDTLHPAPSAPHDARDTAPPTGGTVLIGPAEMFPEHVTVLTDLVGSLTPPGWPAAVALFPATALGARLRSRALDVLTALRATVATPVAAAAAYALDEPPEVVARAEAAARLHGTLAAALHRTVLAAGGLARPPRAGRHLYADLDALRPGLARLGVTDAPELETHLTERLGMPAPGGHRFGDAIGALRVRLSTGPLLGATPEDRLESLHAKDPLHLPHVAHAMHRIETALDVPGAGAHGTETPR
ncbi:aminotransferase class I/II-fold pyridoxal phosphate-dependent enzyme [Streptomyces sp. NPDC060194]|uniref:aminotransferase class I/II-fold pyridoxal phosphate-dependent enzyme n=1 Tax=Streptomyces sp. NPDC060194 TaxID=3347069 RepID=UPI003656FE0F